jgi:hypothetical protein
MASLTRRTPSSGVYGMPICPRRRGSAVPSAQRIRPGAMSSRALTVMASTMG